MIRADSKTPTHTHTEPTSCIGVDLPPRLLDSFYGWFFGLRDVDGARRRFVEEILWMLPQGAVLHSDNLSNGLYKILSFL